MTDEPADGPEDPYDPEWRAMLVQFLIAQDISSKFWPENDVKRARNRFARLHGVPSYDVLCRAFGQERLDVALHEIIQERIAELNFRAKLQGLNDPCHACGGTAGLSYYDFGLVRVVKQKRDWKPVGISAAVSAVAFPIIGVGALYGPGKTITGNLLRMRLVLCGSCVNQRRGMFGGFRADKRYCPIHPMWADLQKAGFTKFVPEYDLGKWH